MKAILYVKSIPRYLTVRGLARRWPAVTTSPFALVRYAEVPEPTLPNASWARVRPLLSGICGSDTATITAKGSPYFSRFVSAPFVFGHEVVGEVVEVGDEAEGVAVGDRVILEPALHCAVRGITPVCPQCRAGRTATCENITKGDLAPGIQTGYCRDTGGGWSGSLVAHGSQLLSVPDEMNDEAAVLIEPLACSVHAVLRAKLDPDATILVLGCGTIGLLTIAAIRGLGYRNRILASAKYPHQREWATALGADEVLPVGKGLYAAIVERTGASLYQPEIGKPVLIGGVDIAFDCVASSSTIDDAVRLTRAGGTVLLVGMPGIPKGIDWTNVWHKELTVSGAYDYGIERTEEGPVRTFEIATRIIGKFDPPLDKLVTDDYPLDRYREAIRNAIEAGRRGSVKVAFRPR